MTKPWISDMNDDDTSVFPRGRLLPWLLAVTGAIGLAAAFTLTVEKIALLKDPEHVPSCSINPVLSCGSVMQTAQAEVFGFPNPLIGVIAFTAVTVLGVVLLAGAVLPRWVWIGLQVGVTFGVVFVHWLIFQSLYRISALCPYCMVVWTVMIPLFWYVTLHNLAGGRLGGPGARIGVAVARFHTVVLAAWYLLVIILIGQAFWTYWRTLL